MMLDVEVEITDDGMDVGRANIVAKTGLNIKIPSTSNTATNPTSIFKGIRLLERIGSLSTTFLPISTSFCTGTGLGRNPLSNSYIFISTRGKSGSIFFIL